VTKLNVKYYIFIICRLECSDFQGIYEMKKMKDRKIKYNREAKALEKPGKKSNRRRNENTQNGLAFLIFVCA